MSDRRWAADAGVSLLLFAAIAQQWVMQSIYHRIVNTSVLIAWILLALMCAVVGFWAARRWLGDGTYRWLSRAAIAAIGLLALDHLVISHLAQIASIPAIVGWTIAFFAWAAVTLAGVRIAHPKWRRVEAAMATAAVVFTLSGVALGWLRAPTVTLFENARGTASTSSPARATVVLLLDELSASASESILGSLRTSGLEVQYKPVRPAGKGTSEVIPAMLSGQVFTDAVACGPTTICGQNVSLDFSKIHVARSDVDFVGFFHPYCAIGGLRSCAFAPFADSPERWTCRIARRAGDIALVEIKRCQALATRQWTEMTEELIAGALKAPVWTRGGILFAHIPLPHPPGITAGAGLQKDYADNLQRANSLVRKMVERLKEGPLDDFKLIIVSDHPLRQAAWCSHYLYRYSGCEVNPHYLDTRVPIIVVSRQPQSPIAIEDNGDILQLVD